MLLAGSIMLHDAMTAMRAARRVFHSEADLQHAFAWEAHRLDPHAAGRTKPRIKRKVDSASRGLYQPLCSRSRPLEPLWQPCPTPVHVTFHVMTVASSASSRSRRRSPAGLIPVPTEYLDMA